jgi:hypothetical protein
MDRPRTPFVVVTLLVLALVAVGLYIGLATAFGSGDGPDETKSDSLQTVLDQGQSLVGKRVSVQGEVSQVLNPHALTLGGDNPSEDDLLVLGRDVKSSLSQPYDGAVVVVTGTVQPFKPSRAKQQYAAAFDSALFQPFQGKPAIRLGHIERVS